MKSRVLFVLLAAILVGSCSSQNSAVSEKSEQISIVFASGGGFTGHMTGIKIEPDGIVTRWSGLPGTDMKPDTVGSLSLEQMQPLYDIIERDDLLSFQFMETGNMTASLVITKGTKRNSLRWPGLETDIEAPPEHLRPFVIALMNTLKQMNNTEK